jgi:hypothetical protein
VILERVGVEWEILIRALGKSEVVPEAESLRKPSVEERPRDSNLGLNVKSRAKRRTRKRRERRDVSSNGESDMSMYIAVVVHNHLERVARSKLRNEHLIRLALIRVNHQQALHAATFYTHSSRLAKLIQRTRYRHDPSTTTHDSPPQLLPPTSLPLHKLPPILLALAALIDLDLHPVPYLVPLFDLAPVPRLANERTDRLFLRPTLSGGDFGEVGAAVTGTGRGVEGYVDSVST